jgi:hypothetical protein
MCRFWPFKRKPLVITFDHIVCKPGDLVVVTLPESVPSRRFNEISASARAWAEEEGVKLLVLSQGVKGSVQ